MLAWSGKYLKIVLLTDGQKIQGVSDTDGFSSQQEVL